MLSKCFEDDACFSGVSWGKLVRSGPGVSRSFAELPGVGPELARSWSGVGPELARSWPGVGSELVGACSEFARSWLGVGSGTTPDFRSTFGVAPELTRSWLGVLPVCFGVVVGITPDSRS